MSIELYKSYAYLLGDKDTHTIRSRASNQSNCELLTLHRTSPESIMVKHDADREGRDTHYHWLYEVRSSGAIVLFYRWTILHHVKLNMFNALLFRNSVWLFIIDETTGQGVYYPYDNLVEHKNQGTPLMLSPFYKDGVFLGYYIPSHPLMLKRKATNRAAGSDIRKRLKPFLDWAKAMIKLSKGKMNLTELMLSSSDIIFGEHKDEVLSKKSTAWIHYVNNKLTYNNYIKYLLNEPNLTTEHLRAALVGFIASNKNLKGVDIEVETSEAHQSPTSPILNPLLSSLPDSSSYLLVVKLEIERFNTLITKSINELGMSTCYKLVPATNKPLTNVINTTNTGVNYE